MQLSTSLCFMQVQLQVKRCKKCGRFLKEPISKPERMMTHDHLVVAGVAKPNTCSLCGRPNRRKKEAK